MEECEDTDSLSDEKETDTTDSDDESSTQMCSVFSGSDTNRRTFQRHQSVDEWLLGVFESKLSEHDKNGINEKHIVIQSENNEINDKDGESRLETESREIIDKENNDKTKSIEKLSQTTKINHCKEKDNLNMSYEIHQNENINEKRESNETDFIRRTDSFSSYFPFAYDTEECHELVYEQIIVDYYQKTDENHEFHEKCYKRYKLDLHINEENLENETEVQDKRNMITNQIFLSSTHKVNAPKENENKKERNYVEDLKDDVNHMNRDETKIKAIDKFKLPVYKCNGFDQNIATPKQSKSLKTCRTPTKDSNSTKIVRFADILGLDLSETRLFAKDIPKVSATENCSLMVESENHTSKYNFDFLLPPPPKPTHLVPIFPQPGSVGNFIDMVQDNKICLESALMTGPTTLTGTVIVLNISFHKEITVMWTVDNWVTMVETNCDYVPGSSSCMTDMFRFQLETAGLAIGSRLELCLRFRAEELEFWDNNGRQNYGFSVVDGRDRVELKTELGAKDLSKKRTL